MSPSTPADWLWERARRHQAARDRHQELKRLKLADIHISERTQSEPIPNMRKTVCSSLVQALAELISQLFLLEPHFGVHRVILRQEIIFLVAFNERMIPTSVQPADTEYCPQGHAWMPAVFRFTG